MRQCFSPGKNIAIKVPAHEFERNVSFYRDVLGFECLEELSEESTSVVFQFGDKRLWIDRVETLSQAEVWLEVVAKDEEAAKEYLRASGCAFMEGIELLPEGFKGFWIANPSNIVHLVACASTPSK